MMYLDHFAALMLAVYFVLNMLTIADLIMKKSIVALIIMVAMASCCFIIFNLMIIRSVMEG